MTDAAQKIIRTTTQHLGIKMSRYLTREELAELIGCQPRSLTCMKRWLDRNRWPYAVNIAGVPLVAREYHDARMAGADSRTTAEADDEIDFEAALR
jgi:hypothetical protein